MSGASPPVADRDSSAPPAVIRDFCKLARLPASDKVDLARAAWLQFVRAVDWADEIYGPKGARRNRGGVGGTAVSLSAFDDISRDPRFVRPRARIVARMTS